MSQTSADIQLPSRPDALRTAVLNIRRMRFLARLAKRFNDAGIPLMVLKGAALHLTVYEKPEERSMCDIDLLVHPNDHARAFALLEECGAYRSQVLLREDFFPRFYYEAEYTAGNVMPVVMDVHIRPFRPLRYAQLVPDDALWDRAQKINLGDAFIHIPCPEDMLMHLAVHCAIHGGAGWKWREDIRRWTRQYQDEMDWDLLLQSARDWRLSLPLLEGIRAARGASTEDLIPNYVENTLEHQPTNWRDRLALKQAPRDDAHPVAHAIVNVLTTPGLGFVIGYLLAVLLPGREHMRQWYPYDHIGWLPAAHLMRVTRPITKRLRWMWRWMLKHELQPDEHGELKLVACRDITPGTIIGRFSVKAASGDPAKDVVMHLADGSKRQNSVAGKMRFIGTAAQPNARLDAYRVIALRHIRPGDEITISPDRQLELNENTLTGSTLSAAA